MASNHRSPIGLLLKRPSSSPLLSPSLSLNLRCSPCRAPVSSALPRTAAAMAPEKRDQARKEAAAAKEEEDDEDNVPIAVSRSKLAKNREPQRKKRPQEKEEEDDDDRPLRPSPKLGKKKPATPNGVGPARVKKEEGEDEEDANRKTPKTEMMGRKREDGKGSAGPAKVKKEEPGGGGTSEDEEDEKDAKKRKKKKMVKKKVVESKKLVKKVGKVTAEENGKKREKKVYDLPGQKHDQPQERDPLRIFYETLYQQLPNSEMAQYWMMEYGLLPSEIAQKIYAKKLKKNPQSKLNSPVKAMSTKKTAVSVKKVKQVSAGKPASKTTAKRKIGSNSSDDDDDFMSPKEKPKKQKVSR